MPTALEAAPQVGFSRTALPLFVPHRQCEGVDTGPVALDAPDTPDRLATRLTYLLAMIEAGAVPPCRVIGLDDGRLTLADVLERKGIADADLSATPLLFTPLWGLSGFDRATVLTRYALP
ncbi:hypothetical protein [Sphingomonas sp.]|uniref:hypothetical protein n=1 Tax=Sphingomonas sp. TaxID=28214 RepID=UPI002D7FEDBC|nr:hypothetical protein [Sphingomonas sp.]HEU0044206.1 hypothetical protein [Sphingomonas sp.]